MPGTRDFTPVMLPPFSERGKFPHLFREESELWKRFLEQFGAAYDGFYYDLRVGMPTVPVEGLKEPYVAMQERLSMKRIDVVGVQPSLLTVFEIRPDARLNVVEQVRNYQAMFGQMYPNTPPTVKAVITNRAERPLVDLCSANDVSLYVI